MNKVLDREVFEESERSVMTNFDHSIELDAEEYLRNNKVFCGYPGWNFHGDVWYEDDVFYCEIWQWGNHVNTLKAENLQEIMDLASEYYGYD